MFGKCRGNMGQLRKKSSFLRKNPLLPMQKYAMMMIDLLKKKITSFSSCVSQYWECYSCCYSGRALFQSNISDLLVTRITPNPAFFSLYSKGIQPSSFRCCWTLFLVLRTSRMSTILYNLSSTGRIKINGKRTDLIITYSLFFRVRYHT